MKFRLTDGTGFRDYKYVIRDRDRDGALLLNFRRIGHPPKTTLHATPGTPEFDAEYRAAFARTEKKVVDFDLDDIEAGRRTTGPAAEGSLRWLCERYFASAAFTQALAPKTRQVRRSVLEGLCLRFGTLPYARMPKDKIVKLRDEKIATPEAANTVMRALRALFNWAGDAANLPAQHLLAVNPAEGIKDLARVNLDGFTPWTEEQVARFEAHWPAGTKERLGLDLLQYTGQRVSDVVRFGAPMVRDGRLCFSEVKGSRKTVKKHELPILPELRASIEAAGGGHLVYLTNREGAPFTPASLSRWFIRSCRAAGLPEGFSAHGLRKLAAVRFAERGASEHELMAWFGWTTPKQASPYTRSVNRHKLEVNAAALFGRVTNGP